MTNIDHLGGWDWSIDEKAVFLGQTVRPSMARQRLRQLVANDPSGVPAKRH